MAGSNFVFYDLQTAPKLDLDKYMKDPNYSAKAKENYSVNYALAPHYYDVMQLMLKTFFPWIALNQVT